jgi:hypothetical protein
MTTASDSDTLLKLAKTATYFHTSDKVACADVYVDGNRHTYPVRSRDFRLWLTWQYYRQTGKVLRSRSFNCVLRTLEAIAILDLQTT